MLVSSQAWQAAMNDVDLDDLSYVDLGSHSLKNIATEVVLFQVLPAEFSARTFPDIATPVERDRADLASEFATLQLSNNELKNRFNNLSKEAEEAAKRAQVLEEWLKEMSRSLPTTLADDLEIMSANLRRLLKSQANLMKELIVSQQRVEVTEESMGALQARLEASVVEIDDLEAQQKELLGKCAFLEEQCTDYEVEILEREFKELKHQRGLITRLIKNSHDEMPEDIRALAEEKKLKRRQASEVSDERTETTPKPNPRRTLSMKFKNRLTMKKNSGSILDDSPGKSSRETKKEPPEETNSE